MNQPTATLIQALCTLVIGAGAIFFAFMQWKVANDKLRLELFDRRYRVFDAARKFLTSAVNKPEYDFKDLVEFYTDTADAEFLFGPEVVKHFKEIQSHLNEMDAHRKARHRMPVGDQHAQSVYAERDERTWLLNQFAEMTKIFTPYLSYANVKNDYPLSNIRAWARRIHVRLYFDARDDK